MALSYRRIKYMSKFEPGESANRTPVCYMRLDPVKDMIHRTSSFNRAWITPSGLVLDERYALTN